MLHCQKTNRHVQRPIERGREEIFGQVWVRNRRTNIKINTHTHTLSTDREQSLKRHSMDSFARLPEECISTILSLTSPMDTTKFSIISHGFKSASDSDNVWERFLPPDYRQIISTSVSPVLYATKKHLYFNLCHSPILLHEGNTVSSFLVHFHFISR